MDTGIKERTFSAKRIKLMDTGSKERTSSDKTRVQNYGYRNPPGLR